MNTKELLTECKNARLASKASPNNTSLKNKADVAYDALFSTDRISEILRGMDNAVPGIRDGKTPVVWNGIFPTTYVKV